MFYILRIYVQSVINIYSIYFEYIINAEYQQIIITLNHLLKLEGKLSVEKKFSTSSLH